MVSIKLITAITLALAATVSSAPAPHGHKTHGHHHNKLVRGKYFDRFMVVVLENQDYEVKDHQVRTFKM
jgi:hypothetical protein